MEKDTNTYIKAWRKRALAAQEATKRRAEVALKVSQNCAKILVEKFGAKRVYLFGSLAEGFFRETSDIDLVVEGPRPELYFKASAQISRRFREFQIDLIPWEDYKYKREVWEKGKLLYESG